MAGRRAGCRGCRGAARAAQDRVGRVARQAANEFAVDKMKPAEAGYQQHAFVTCFSRFALSTSKFDVIRRTGAEHALLAAVLPPCLADPPSRTVDPAGDRRSIVRLSGIEGGEQGVYTYAVNGWFDHVHMVVAVPPLLAVSELVKQLKGASSRFLHTEAGLPTQFTWQRGYGALSVGERQRPVAERYVERQKEHHARQTTNSWLEYVAEADDGPTRPGDTQQIREAQQPYDQDEFPF